MKASNIIYNKQFKSNQEIHCRSRTKLVKMAKTRLSINFRSWIHAWFFKLEAIKLQNYSMNINKHDYKLNSHNERLNFEIQSSRSNLKSENVKSCKSLLSLQSKPWSTILDAYGRECSKKLEECTSRSWEMKKTLKMVVMEFSLNLSKWGVVLKQWAMLSLI